MSRKRAKRVTRRGTTRSTGPIDKYFGDRIRARRVMLKMSQEELGEKLGVSFQQIQKYEKGVNRVSAAMMVSVAGILDVDMGYFYDEIPKVRRGREIETPALTELALTLHGRRLIDAFLNLKNDQLRGAVADLAHVLARGAGRCNIVES
jgi:transcriptional regulator with XRE-family HTH domain